MRYYFHLESETNIHIDHRGRAFEAAKEAEEHAAAMVRQLAEEDRWLGWMVRVIDARNKEVICLQIVDSVLHG
jgi:hypothetical protein